VTINELVDGIVARTPVVHVIDTVLLAVIAQSIPSILTDKVVPKLVPVIVKIVPPTLGPNLELKLEIVEVLACEYVTAFVKVISVGPLITISHNLSTPFVTLIVE